MPSSGHLGQRRSAARARGQVAGALAGRARPRSSETSQATSSLDPVGQPGRDQAGPAAGLPRAPVVLAGQGGQQHRQLAALVPRGLDVPRVGSAVYIASKSGGGHRRDPTTLVRPADARRAAATGSRSGAQRLDLGAVRRQRRTTGAAAPAPRGHRAPRRRPRRPASVQCMVHSSELRHRTPAVPAAARGPAHRLVVGVRVGRQSVATRSGAVLGDRAATACRIVRVGVAEPGCRAGPARVSWPRRARGPRSWPRRGAARPGPRPAPRRGPGGLAGRHHDDLHGYAATSQPGQRASHRERLVVGVRDHDEQPVSGGGAHGVRRRITGRGASSRRAHASACTGSGVNGRGAGSVAATGLLGRRGGRLGVNRPSTVDPLAGKPCAGPPPGRVSGR